MNRSELIETLKVEINNDERLKEYLDSRIHEFRYIQKISHKNKQKIKRDFLNEFEIKIISLLNKDKMDKINDLSSESFNPYTNIDNESIFRCYRNFIVGSYIVLSRESFGDGYEHENEDAFRYSIKYLQDTIVSFYTYKKVLASLKVKDRNANKEVLESCLNANFYLLAKMYNYIIKNYNNYPDFDITYASNLLENELFKDKLFKIRTIEDFRYIYGMISEDTYEHIKADRDERYRSYAVKMSKELAKKSETKNVEEKELKQNVQKIKKILKESEKEAKSRIMKTYGNEFRSVQVYAHKIDFTEMYEEMQEHIKPNYLCLKSDYVAEVLKELMHLRTQALKYELATGKILGQKRIVVYDDGRPLREIYSEIYESTANAFMQLFQCVNSGLKKDEKLELDYFICKNGLIDLVARRREEMNVTTLKGFRSFCKSFQDKKISKKTKNKSKDSNSKEGSKVPVGHIIKSFTVNNLHTRFKNNNEFSMNRKFNDEEECFPRKIKMNEFNEDILKSILEGLHLSEEIIEEDFIQNKDLLLFNEKKLNDLKNHFIKYSYLRKEVNTFKYKYEREDLLLKDLRIAYDLILKYLKYKAICIQDEKLCDIFDEETFYLESILSDINMIFAKLVYCTVDMLGDMYFDGKINMYNLIHADKYRNLISKKGLSKVQRLEELKAIYEEVLKEQVIATYEKNPADEYLETRAMKRKFIIHSGQTNSGKTYEAIEDLKMATNGTYLAPLRLLAIEVQEKMLDSGVKCSLLTGEEEFSVDNATHVSSTVEKADFSTKFEVAVIDECQMIGDRDRGGAWTKAILGVKANVIHLCTAPSSVDLLVKLIKSCDDEYEIINHKRNTKLVMDKEVFKDFEDCKKGDALIVFSKKNVLSVASALLNRGIKSSIIYGALPYKTRKLQMERFLNGETDVIVSTDAISMGLNLPIKRVIFIDSHKYDGYVKRKLFTEEVKQIAGRAGRYGIYDIGYVNALENYAEIESKLNSGYWNIEKAKLQLPESIINIEGDLYENIKLWKKVDYLDGFEKCNVDRELTILKMLDNMGYSDIGNMYKYKLATMYFSENDRMTYLLWSRYLKAYFRDLDDEMVKPNVNNYEDNLQGLESYCKSIELYYVFSKAFSLDMDLEWVREEKLKISEKINATLISEVKTYQKKCRVCGKELKWDSIDTICTKCALYEAFGKGNSQIRLKRA